MQKKDKHLHEPLITITSRGRDTMPWQKSWGVRIIAIAIALILCALVIVFLTGYNPIEVYAAMIKGNFGSTRKIWNMLQKLAMLLCVSLAVTPAFKMKFWNSGAEGQTLVGGLATAACMIYFGNSMPIYLLIPVMAGASIIAGMVWGIIPAFFKAKFNTNETLFTLMMNYVATQLVSFFIVMWENPKDSNTVGVINSATSGGWLPSIFGQKYLLNIIIVAVLTVAMYVYLKYSKHGYEISVVGESINTAKYVGIKVDKVIIRTMILSGAIAGLVGFVLAGSINHTISTASANNMGFTGIMATWLASFNPLLIMLTSFFITFISKGMV